MKSQRRVIENLTMFKKIVDQVALDVGNFLPYLAGAATVRLTESQLSWVRSNGQEAIDALKPVLKERLGALGLTLINWHIDLADDERGFEFRIVRTTDLVDPLAGES